MSERFAAACRISGKKQLCVEAPTTNPETVCLQVPVKQIPSLCPPQLGGAAPRERPSLEKAPLHFAIVNTECVTIEQDESFPRIQTRS